MARQWSTGCETDNPVTKERPRSNWRGRVQATSPRYVQPSSCLHHKTGCGLTLLPDDATDCETTPPRRCHPCQAPPFLSEQSAPRRQRGQMDTRGSKTSHRILQRRIHSLERYGLQLRDDHAGTSVGTSVIGERRGIAHILLLIQAHDVAIRSATYSHNEDWLLSACNDGVIKYWQPNFNNVKAIQAHTDPIRGISFSPNDAKFVTASDDATLKIFDFSGGVEESTLTGHQWDAKTVDWHPTKGLLVSGSKDHQVKLWDPRTGRCLTTLHGHKNTLTKTLFEPSRGQLLATCGRDQVARVFDLRMMRDICLLRGHEKEVSTLTWHPFHTCLLSTGGNDGSIFHYLLNEPNTPANTTTSIPPYDSADPKNAPAQTIYPAHRLQHAHDMPVWSLDWHPLGHILASGSNDRVTRFWTRARPGETDCFNDRWHIGGEAAEMLGTWDRRNGKRSMREEEEMEIEDEADGLVDQTMPSRNQATLPGLPGLTLPSANASIDNNSSAPIRNGLPAPNNNLPPPPMIPPPGGIPGMDPAKFAELLASGKFPPPPPPGIHAQGFPPPPPLPPNFDFSKFPPGLFPPPIPIPPPPSQEPSPGGLPGLNDNPGGGGGSVRRRGPLPSQQESLKMEQQKGKYRPVR